MINSGIKNDTQVFRNSTSRANSVSFSRPKSKGDEDTDIYEEHSSELENRLISSEIDATPNSSNDKIAASNYK